MHEHLPMFGVTKVEESDQYGKKFTRGTDGITNYIVTKTTI